MVRFSGIGQNPVAVPVKIEKVVSFRFEIRRIQRKGTSSRTELDGITEGILTSLLRWLFLHEGHEGLRIRRGSKLMYFEETLLKSLSVAFEGFLCF